MRRERRRVFRLGTGAAILAAWLCAASQAAPQVDPAAPASAATLASADARLKQLVSLDVFGTPTSAAVEMLGRDSGVQFSVSKEVGDQRISVRVVRRPLAELMDRLTEVLSHRPPTRRGYHWRTTGGGDHTSYALYRDRASVREERELLEKPRRTLFRWLTDLGRLSRIPKEQWSGYRSDLNLQGWKSTELQPYFTALATVSEHDIRRLAAGEAVPVDRRPFASELERRKQREVAALEQRREAALKIPGGRDPFPTGIPNVPEIQPKLRLIWNNQDGDDPAGAASWELRLDGVMDFQVGLDPWGRYGNPNGPAPGEGPVVDLSPWLGSADVTPEDRGDSGFALLALARATGVNLYQEHFHKPTGLANRFVGRSRGIQPLKAPLGTLLDLICREWDLAYRVVEGDYLFWSVAWPLDRRADIPEREVWEWRDRATQEGGWLGIGARAELARRYTQFQLRQTMELALPQAGKWPSATTRALRYLAGLTADQRTLAFSSGGLPLRRISLNRRSELRAALGLNDAVSGSTALLRGNLTIREDTPPPTTPRRPGPRLPGYVITVVDGGEILAQALIPPVDGDH